MGSRTEGKSNTFKEDTKIIRHWSLQIKRSIC